LLENRKCSECGAVLELRFQVSDRDFYIKDGELLEDKNTWFEPTFIIHCSEDFEHDIEKNLTEEQSDELLEWKKKIVEEAIKKFKLDDNLEIRLI